MGSDLIGVELVCIGSACAAVGRALPKACRLPVESCAEIGASPTFHNRPVLASAPAPAIAFLPCRIVVWRLSCARQNW